MNNDRKEAFFEKLRKIMLPLKQFATDTISAKPKAFGLAAAILVLVLILALVLTTCSRTEPIEEPADTATEAQTEDTAPATEPAAVEPQIVGIPATMGIVTRDDLSICKDAGVEIDVEAYYAKGDRVEIQETKDIDGTLWGYTGRGWILMDYVRMDDVAPDSEDSTNSDGTTIASNGSYAVLGYGVVDLKSLNVRVGPGTDYSKIKEVFQGIRYAYYEESDGWVRISDGWVSTDYFYVEGTTAKDATTGTITTNDLNVRTGPDTSFQRVTQYMEGDSVEILAEVNGWGYTEQGWISMMYVELPEPVYTTGSATVTIGLNIREEPNAASALLDTYSEGDQITILEVQDGWGRTDKGWINLDYVKYD